MPRTRTKDRESLKDGFLSSVGLQSLISPRRAKEPANVEPRTHFSLGARLSEASGSDWRACEVSVDGNRSHTKFKGSGYQPLSDWLNQMNKRRNLRRDVIEERTQAERQQRAELKERLQGRMEQAVVHRKPNGIAQTTSLPEHRHRSEASVQLPADGGPPVDEQGPIVRRNTRSSRFSINRTSSFGEPLLMSRTSSMESGTRRRSRESSFDGTGVDPDEYRHRSLVELSKKHNIALSTVQSIRHEFERMDVNGNEEISTEEFQAWLHKELGLKPGEDVPSCHLIRNFADADSDGNGVLDFEEFLLWRHARHFVEDLILDKDQDRRLREVARSYGLTIPEVENIKKEFDRFDLDSSGLIDRDEFKKCLVALLKGKDISDMPQNRLDRYWREIDVDQSGTVSLDEFLVWYIKYFYVPKGESDEQGDICGPITQAYSSLGTNRLRKSSILMNLENALDFD